MKRYSPALSRYALAVFAVSTALQAGATRAQDADATSGAEPRPPIVVTDQARKLHESALLIDGHNDLPWEIRTNGSSDFSKLDISQPQPSLHTDIGRLREGGLGAQFWSVYVPVEYGYQGRGLSATLEQIELVKLMIQRYPDTFAFALSTDDIRREYAAGKIASLIGVEGGYSIEESLSVLNHLYDAGARYMTLTHSDTLSWADSATDKPQHEGLTDFGREVVREMNRLGMLVDLSHVSIDTMNDALDVSTAPVIFSHSSSRAICDHPRNVPDEVLRRLKEKDGVVMVNFFSSFIVPKAADLYAEQFELRRELKAKYGDDDPRVDSEISRWRVSHRSPRGTIHDLLDHIDHIAEVAGVEHVGIGSDYDGVSMLPEQLDDVSYYPYITQGLLDRGYSEDDIRAILGENLMRVFGKAEQVAKELQQSEPAR